MSVTGIVDEGLGNTSYIVDLGDGGALVVDPERDPRPYFEELERQGLRARYVVETHLHADFVSGSRQLTSAGAELLAPAGSALAFPHRGLRDGEEMPLGGLVLKVIATPGHTPEHLSYLLLDGSRPIGLLSGGTLMAGGVARTDLVSAEQTEPLARAAYRSIREHLFTLPDDLAVFPTHGPGSFCSVGTGTERTTTIGREKTSNPLLSDDPDEDTFVGRLLAGYGSYPPYFLELREVNRSGPFQHRTPLPPPTPLTVAEVEAAMAGGAELIDARPLNQFAAGHIPGALSNPWRPQFATWLGWLVSRETPLVFVVDATVEQEDLLWASLTVGFENFIGVLAGGMTAWFEAGRTTNHIPVVSDSPTANARTVVDVRQNSEHASGHLPGAISVELGSIDDSGGDLPRGGLLVHCGHGERAMTAASLLLRAGHDDVAVLEGSPGRLGELVTDL